MTIKSEKLQELGNALNMLNEKEKLEFVIELGNELEELSEKKSEYKISGCTSEAYIKIIENNEKLILKGNADSIIVKGYIEILRQTVDGQTKKYIEKDFEKDIKEFLEETKLDLNMLPSRANAFGNMIQHIITKTKEYN